MIAVWGYMGLNIANEVVHWMLSFGPVGLAIEFVATVVVVSTAIWFVAKTFSPVFWKRTDYAYFILTITGGALGAADLAVSNWGKELQQLQLTILSDIDYIRASVGSAVYQCDQRNSDGMGDKDIIKPEPRNDGRPTFGRGIQALSDSDCDIARQLSKDIASDKLDELITLSLSKLQSHNRENDLAEGFFKSVILDFRGMLVVKSLQLHNSETRSNELRERLASLGFLSKLKILSPILLGLGIGVRLARTHYDVEIERRKSAKAAT